MSERIADAPSAKIVAPDHDIDEVFRKRWSPRAFADRPVEPAKIRRMLEAARWTMSSYNEQPWRYVVATQDDTDAYTAVLECLTEGNQEWAQLAPVLMLSFVKTTFSRDGRPNRHAQHDVGAASAALTFQAMEMGLYVHQMAGIQPEAIRSTFDLPEEVEPMTGLAVGYLGNPSRLPERRQEAERSPRSRKPLSDFVFGTEWGSAPSLSDGPAA
jgi:nitroreductase